MNTKTKLSLAIAATFGASVLPVTSTQAALLNFDAGVKSCVLGGTPPNNCAYGVTTTTGSWFAYDADAAGTITDSEKTPMVQHDGLIVDGLTTQAASGSHTGAPDGTESPGIDNPWAFFGNTGMHKTTSPINVASNDGAGHVELDFTGWNIPWDNIESVPMGGDPANFGISEWYGVFINSGIAVMSCSIGGILSDCVDGVDYVLDYAAQVPLGSPTGTGGVPYYLHLEGTISGTLPAVAAVPVPAAAWLFGSGLLGLIGLARRKT